MTPLRAAVKADEDEAPSVAVAAVAGLQRGNPPPSSLPLVNPPLVCRFHQVASFFHIFHPD